MDDFITKYFRSTEGESDFNPPATDTQIIALEDQLGVQLPKDYKDFLKFTNGCDGWVNEFVVNFEPVDKVYESTQETCDEFFPGMIYIGTNGGGEMFVIDARSVPYQFGLLPCIGDMDDFIPLGDTFERFISRLYNDTAFDRLK